jgi:hypothetical protein
VTVPEPRLAGSLTRLLAEVDALWPDRSRASDGWLGDAAHAARQSDHNPDERGIVHALDVTASGIHLTAFLVAVTHHMAVHYVISRSVLYSVRHGFRGVPYTGTNPHRTHVHVSIRHTTGAERSRIDWLSG